jgi:alpha-1,3-rhamnosyl/mannosyltransferase
VKYILDGRTATPHFPGIGRYVENLAAGIAPLLRGDETLEVLRPSGISTSPFGLSQQWRVPPLLRDAAVYHSPYYLMPYRPGLPAVLTVYDLIPQLFPAGVSARARLWFRLAMRLALRAADQVICISESTRRDLLAHYSVDPARVSAIPLAPAAHFRPQGADEQERVRRKFGLDGRFALYVGINKPHKNLVRLVEAWARVQSDAILLIGGAWDARYPQVKVRAAELGLGERVRFIGRVEEADLPGLYSACELFVFPSRYEGFGLPVVEALACGAAVACANTSSLPEVGGEAAAYFEPGDVGGMAEVLEGILETGDGRRETGRLAVAQAAQFSWERTARATLAVYRREA